MTSETRSKRLPSKVICRVLSVWVFLFLVVLSEPQVALACNVTEVDLWIGVDEDDAEGENTDAIYKAVGVDSFGWYVEWTADTPDDEDFKGLIYVGDLPVGIIATAAPAGDGPTQREASDTSSITSIETTGSYVVSAKVCRDQPDPEEDVYVECDTTRTLVIVGVDKVVLDGTTDDSTIIVGIGTTVYLEALADPASTFPDGEPAWEITSRPDPENPGDPDPGSLSATDEDATLSGLTVAGSYTVKATCGTSSDSIGVTVVDVDDIIVTKSAGVNGLVVGRVECSVTPDYWPIEWTIEGGSLDCSIAKDGEDYTKAKITPSSTSTGGTITVRATTYGWEWCYEEVELDVVKISGMAFSPSTIVVDGQGTRDSTTATVTVVPSGRTINWEILPENLGCSLVTNPALATTDLDSGDESGTITVRAKDSEIEDCYLNCSLNILGIEITTSPDEDAVCLVYTGNYPSLVPDDHPDAGDPIHGDEPEHTFTAQGSVSGGEYLWDAIDESGCGMFEIASGSTLATAKIIGARASPTEDDAILLVTYTVDGASAEQELIWTVSKPNSIVLINGNPEVQTPTINGENFFFKVKDQFGTEIKVEDITCWEKLTWLKGAAIENIKESWNTTGQYPPAEGSYNGTDIVFKDRLQIGASLPYTELHQQFYVGGWLVSPEYFLTLYYHTWPDGITRAVD